MSPENDPPIPLPDILRNSYDQLTRDVLDRFYRQGVLFGSWPRTPKWVIEINNGLVLALIYPEGGPPAQVSAYRQDLYIGQASDTNPIKIYGGRLIVGGKPTDTWSGDSLRLVQCGKPVDTLALRNGTGLERIRFATGPVKMVGVFSGCSGIESQTILRKAFVVVH